VLPHEIVEYEIKGQRVAVSLDLLAESIGGHSYTGPGCSEQVTPSGSASARITMVGIQNSTPSEPFGRRPWNGSFGRITYRRWRPNLSRRISLRRKAGEILLTFLGGDGEDAGSITAGSTAKPTIRWYKGEQ
jgi:hypothetical protein